MEKIKDRRTLAAAAGICLLLAIAAVSLAFTLTPADVAVFRTSQSAETAALTLCVLEGYTESPIENATVVILETGKTYKTNENGLTDVIEVPVIRDTRYDAILEKPWGEISLIVYKDGFVPYALFYLQVLAGQTGKHRQRRAVFHHRRAEPRLGKPACQDVSAPIMSVTVAP
jgi:hypothetical protein